MDRRRRHELPSWRPLTPSQTTSSPPPFDEKTAGYTDRFSKWKSAEEAFAFWAGRIVGFIDNTRDMK